MILLFFFLLHPYFHRCPNRSSYLRLRNHQTRHYWKHADTKMSLIRAITKALHQPDFHPHSKCPSLKCTTPSTSTWPASKWLQDKAWVSASQQSLTWQHNQPSGRSSSTTYRVLIVQEFPTIPPLVQKERQVFCLLRCKGITAKLILLVRRTGRAPRHLGPEL